jgi:hypothetical protein
MKIQVHGVSPFAFCGTDKGILFQFTNARAVAADRAITIAFGLNFPEAHLQGIVNQEPAGQGIPNPK